MSSLLDALIAAEEFPPLKGDRGPKGDVGDKGDKGDTGYQGPEGPTGPMGPDGPEGPGGPEGPEGKRGPKGLKGDDGEKGDKGDEGPAGRDGGVAGGRSYNVRGFASGMVIDDEGTKINGGAVVGEIDFAGAGVSVAQVGAKAVVTVAGGSGLPSGGTVGQVVTNTGPGAGDWEDASGLPPQWTDGGNGDVTATVDDPAKTPITIAPAVAQSEPLLLLENASAGEAVEAFANGSINQYLTNPAVIGWLIKMASGQTASPLRIDDDSGNHIFDFDPASGAILIRSVNGGAIAVSSWYAQSFANYAESDLAMSANGIQAVELDTYVDNITPANSYTHIAYKTQPLQGAGVPVLDLWNSDLGKYVHRILISGAISTSGTVPADGDILTGETFFWFDPTNGAASPKWKGKQADGTVVSGSLGGGAPSFLSVAKWG